MRPCTCSTVIVIIGLTSVVGAKFNGSWGRVRSNYSHAPATANSVHQTVDITGDHGVIIITLEI